MMTPMNMGRRNRGSETARRVAEIVDRLPEDQRQTLLRFAEFLLAEAPETESVPETLPEPKAIPRPAEESVIKAMRRLSETYFMLERGKLLNETSALMAQHVMQGRDVVEVVDELEVIFATHYERARSAS
jgi:hypothetical protein